MPQKKDYSEDTNSFFFNEQNKKKLDELNKKYGMIHSGESKNASPELVNKFLDNVQKFEEAFEKGEVKKIIEILKYPHFKNLTELNPGEISEEINKILDLYAKYNINIDVIEEEDVKEKDFYKFLTEELPLEKLQLIEIEGFWSNFIYEDFHPNDKLDAKDAIRSFLCDITDDDDKYSDMWLAKDKLFFNGDARSLPEFIKSVKNILPGKIKENQIVYKDFDLSEQNKVKTDLFIIDKATGKELKQNAKFLHLIFELQKYEYGGLEITSCSNVVD